MNYAFPPAPVVAIPAMSSNPFPVRHIYCAVQNYAGAQDQPGAQGPAAGEVPFFFMKPALSILPNNAVLPFPPATAELNANVALVVALNLGGRDIREDQANDYIFGYAVGLDMTRGDLEKTAKAGRQPWDMSKVFDWSTPVSALTPEFYSGLITRGPIALKVNGTVRQAADMGDMLCTVPRLIAGLSRLVELHPGDLVFTGSPQGLAPVARGDRLEATVAGLEPLLVTVS